MDMRAVFQGVVFPTTATTTAAAAAAQTVLPFASTSHEYGGSDGGHGHGHGGPTANIIESLLPLFGLRGLAPLYGLVGGSLGVDTTYLLTFFGVAWALNRLLSQLYHLGYGLVSDHLMSSIHVSSSDDIYLHLMKWLAAQPRMVNSRSLTAETISHTAWEDENTDEASMAWDQSGQYLNFSNQEAKLPPQFVPALGLHNFWWRGQYFRLHRKRESLFDDTGTSSSTFKEKEDLVISCLWRNPEPIKQLLKHAKEQYFVDHQARTTVKRNMRRYGGRCTWQQVANRPVRDMRTVVLDAHQKTDILADINEYLHPATPRWYANRGIPLRRGYLFHGPPGTGKTSLSFALAGVFGLDIYVISLQEPTLTEEDLCTLFGTLPRRCVVLLEDIDSAGLRRPVDQQEPEQEVKKADAEEERKNEEGEKTTNGIADDGGKNNGDSKPKNRGRGRPSSTTTANDWKVSDLAKALKKEGNSDEKKGISLSGLLNAIDGVASHEGRVLIMTTNAPESLDEALIRPGRVDLQVEFGNATRHQAEELFVRMYEVDRSHQRHTYSRVDAAGRDRPAAAAAAAKGSASLTEKGVGSGHAAPLPLPSEPTPAPAAADLLDIAEDQLSSVALQFAQKIPDSQFSPAEIQGYLLKRKKHPQKAVEEADEWVEALLRQKASKSKVIKVQ